MSFKKYLLYVFYGFIIGGCMLVPGVSGGTVAVLLGIYDRLLGATADILTQFKKSILILSSVALGGIIGFISMSGIIDRLLKEAPLSTIYFFMGTIVGGIVLIFFGKGSKKTKISVPMIILGAGAVLLLKFLPEGTCVYSGNSVWIRFPAMIIVGLLLGAALILPGISFSMTLMTLGIYERFLQAINDFDILFLLPIAFATIFGIIVLSKLLSCFMREYPRLCSSMILGFVLASVAELFPGIPRQKALISCLLIAMLGFLLTSGPALYLQQKNNVKTVTSHSR